MVRENISLRTLNTFGIDVRARYLVSIDSIEALQSLISDRLTNSFHHVLVLGGGSNILFTRDFEGLIIKMNTRGVDILNETDDYADIIAYAGEDWDQLVSFCVHKGLGGIENLSLIPGTVGASPVQNIGAYGAELGDVLTKVTVIDRHTGHMEIIPSASCGLGYRTSIFKAKEKGRYIILSVALRLNKHPVFNVHYGSIGEELNRMGISRPTLQAMRQAVIHIRQSKLPDPKVLANAGSFFKNPSVSASDFESLRSSFPDIVGYSQSDNTFKIAAGWMIDRCGWKGYRRGDAGVHAKQALVLVNHGRASGSEILSLAQEIHQSVQDRFGIPLEYEVSVY